MTLQIIPILIVKQKNTLSIRIGSKTPLRLSLAHDRKWTDFQRRFEKISSFEVGTGEATFPRSWLSSPPWEIRSSEFHLFLEKVWTKSDC
jgi:hypothetical protein